jgi:hypothetical protein
MRNRFEIARDARAALWAEQAAMADGTDVEIDRLVVEVADGAPTDGLGPVIARGVVAQLDALGGQGSRRREDRE